MDINEQRYTLSTFNVLELGETSFNFSAKGELKDEKLRSKYLWPLSPTVVQLEGSAEEILLKAAMNTAAIIAAQLSEKNGSSVEKEILSLLALLKSKL